MPVSREPSPAAQARIKAGLTVEQAAKRALITPAYLKQVERPSVGACYGLATRLAGMYGKCGAPCSIAVFLPTARKKTTEATTKKAEHTEAQPAEGHLAAASATTASADTTDTTAAAAAELPSSSSTRAGSRTTRGKTSSAVSSVPEVEPPLRASDAGATLPAADLPNLIELFLAAGDISQHSPATLTNRRNRLSKLLWFVQHRGYKNIGVYHLRQFLYYLSHGHEEKEGRWGNAQQSQNVKPVSSGTVKSYHSTMQTFFNWCVEEEVLTASPMRKIPPTIDRPDQVHPFTDEQLRSMFVSAKAGVNVGSKRDEAIFYVLLDTGIRASELCGLMASDVDFASGPIGSLRIRHGKGGKGRTVPFSGITKFTLHRYLKQRDDLESLNAEKPLFVAERGANTKGALTRDGLRKIVYRWCAEAGINREHGSPHTFRHTFAISFLRAGGNVFTLKAILGHNSLAIVNRYVAIAQADITRQHEQFSPVAHFKEGKSR